MYAVCPYSVSLLGNDDIVKENILDGCQSMWKIELLSECIMLWLVQIIRFYLGNWTVRWLDSELDNEIVNNVKNYLSHACAKYTIWAGKCKRCQKNILTRNFIFESGQIKWDDIEKSSGSFVRAKKLQWRETIEYLQNTWNGANTQHFSYDDGSRKFILCDVRCAYAE